MKDALIFFGGALLIFSICVGGVATLRSVQCHARWANSGVKSSYTIGTGCLVQRPNGLWIPESAVREIGVLI